MEATETPTKMSSTPTTATAPPPAMPNAADSNVRMNEAAYEALGILETMYWHGNIPPLYRDLCATVIAKSRQARRDMNRWLA